MSVTDTRTPNSAGLDPAAVAARAYAIWVRGGRRPARALEDWLQAERELRDESAKAVPVACCGQAMPAPAPAPTPSVPPAPAPDPAPTPTAPAAAKPPSKPPVGQRPAKKGRRGKRK